MPLVSYEASEVTKTEGENGRGALPGEPTCHALRGALACSSLGSRWAYLLPGRKGAKAVLWARVLDDGDAGGRLGHEGQPSALWPVLLYQTSLLSKEGYHRGVERAGFSKDVRGPESVAQSSLMGPWLSLSCCEAPELLKQTSTRAPGALGPFSAQV